MKKHRYLMILTRGVEQRVFIFKAKDQVEAMKVADTEFKKWKLAKSYEVYELTKEVYTKEPNLVLPFMAHCRRVAINPNENL